jgi:hypothetical protein
LLEQAGSLVTVRVVEAKLHYDSTIVAQEAALCAVEDWLVGLDHPRAERKPGLEAATP